MDRRLLHNIRRVHVVVFLLIICWHAASAQDVLGLLLSGDDCSKSMGGNPFSSWSQSSELSPLSVEDERSRVSFDYRYDNILHEVNPDGTETLLQNTVRQVNVSIPLADVTLSPKLGLSVISSGSTAIMDQSPSEVANYEGDRKAVTLSYDTPLGESMRIGVAMGQSYDSPPSAASYEGNISFLLPGGISASAKIGNWEHSEALQLQISGTDGVLPLDYVERGVHLSLFFPLGDFTFIASGDENDLFRAITMSRSYGTRFAPSGTDADYQLESMVSLSKRWKMLLSMAGQLLKGDGMFYSQAQEYGAVNGFEFGSFTLQGAAQFAFSTIGIIESDIKWQSLGGNIQGYAEAWPFTSIFDSPVPIRENVEASGRLDMLQFHIGGKVPVNHQFECGFGASILQAFPNLELDSWEAKYLIFGVRNYTQRLLAVNQIDAILLSTGAQLKIFPFIINYSITQLVPLRITRSGSSSSGAVLSSSGGGRASGGQFHHLTVVYEF